MTQPYATLNNGVRMPLLGLGAWDMYGSEAEKATLDALETGYRLIDTASMYRNEKEVGNAVRQSGIPRDELFITTKVNNPDQGYDATLRAFERSLEELNTGHIDLYLIHWPIRNQRADTWKALEHLYTSGQVRAIGVANYLVPFLQELEGMASVVPAVDQVEFSPWLYLDDLLQHCGRKGIVLQSYSPLTRGIKLTEPKVQELSARYGKTPAQIVLRWNIQLGVSTIPKSSNLARLKENFDIFDFELSAEDMQLLCSWNEGFRVVEDPMNFW
ncbi:MAG TPA: aldo/keto reductase [Chitinophagaceae bacterium]|jgi:diketogulonate reductase-like aldo/keto reductase|nr:aldo/keto reductase [Chitinophagaceae bacterium]